MAVVGVYRTIYHFEINGRISGSGAYDYIEAANGNYSTLKAVLSSNNRFVVPGGTLVLDSVQEVGHSDIAVA